MTASSRAVAEWLLRPAGGDLPDRLKSWFRQFPYAGYGGTFARWASSSTRSAYSSWGNGSAMRASPVGFAFDTLDETLRQAARSADVTRDHPKGIKGAQTTASAIFLARTGHPKAAIRSFAESRFGYDLSRPLDEIRPGYCFDVSCKGSVPEAIIVFLESRNWEDAVRQAISLGGIRTPSPASPAGSPRPITAESRRRFAPKLRDGCRQRCGQSWWSFC